NSTSRMIIVVRGFLKGISDRCRWFPPKAEGKVDPHRLTQVGALWELGVQMIPACSPQARSRRERNLIHTPEAANRFLREHYMAELNHFEVPARERGGALVRRSSKDLELIFSLQSKRTSAATLPQLRQAIP